MLDKQLQHSWLSCGISDRQMAQCPSVIKSRRSLQSHADTVTVPSSPSISMPPHPSVPNFMSHPILGEPGSVGAEIASAIGIEINIMTGELARKSVLHLVFSDSLYLSGSDDAFRVDGSNGTNGAFVSANDPDFAFFVIGWGHFGPPVGLLI